ncbi:DNA polymerase III subunit [Erysipelothrix anatis]|uniref:DNA polymerase III subunit n=1 Tax=Erysipelothrix anatis TaxID=2683713 RepID=UPI0013594330|nr:DNA polymerase III subunit [Erysipelothrix anatis]
MNVQTEALNLFHKQQEKNRVSHAYLIVGKSDAFSFAEYMAQSLMCMQQEIGACGTCSVCLRIKERTHGDYSVLSSKDESIKKQEIVTLKEQFVQTNMEVNSRKVYIIEDVENASIAAMNSILKFLEEPDSDVTAILTTSQPNRVLETIKSRCLLIQLKDNDQKLLFEAGIEEGLDEQDAYLLSRVENTVEEMLSVSQSEGYQATVDLALEVLGMLNDMRIHEGVVLMQHRGIKQKVLDKTTIDLFLDVLLVSLDFETFPKFNQYVDKMNDNTKLGYKKRVLMIKDRIRPGVNTNLLIDQLAYEIVNQHKTFTL